MKYKSAVHFLRDANGKLVRKVCEGVATADMWPAMRENIMSQLIEQGAKPDDITEDEAGIHIGHQVFFKPKLAKETVAKLNVSSKQYEHGNIYGALTGLKPHGNGVRKTYDSGLVVYLELADQ